MVGWQLHLQFLISYFILVINSMHGATKFCILADFANCPHNNLLFLYNKILSSPFKLPNQDVLKNISWILQLTRNSYSFLIFKEFFANIYIVFANLQKRTWSWHYNYANSLGSNVSLVLSFKKKEKHIRWFHLYSDYKPIVFNGKITRRFLYGHNNDIHSK